jgi:hypothetical protein
LNKKEENKMELIIRKKIQVLLKEEKPNKYKNDAIESRVYFNDYPIHPKTKTDQKIVESLKVSPECQTQFTIGKTYFVDLKQFINKTGEAFYSIVNAEETK